LSNEEETNDYENFEKGMIYMKILKKRGGSREKGRGGNEIHAPCACALSNNHPRLNSNMHKIFHLPLKKIFTQHHAIYIHLAIS
jgi:hypothetical protein